MTTALVPVLDVYAMLVGVVHIAKFCLVQIIVVLMGFATTARVIADQGFPGKVVSGRIHQTPLIQNVAFNFHFFAVMVHAQLQLGCVLDFELQIKIGTPPFMTQIL
jgi:hypothetical protein